MMRIWNILRTAFCEQHPKRSSFTTQLSCSVYVCMYNMKTVTLKKSKCLMTSYLSVLIWTCKLYTYQSSLPLLCHYKSLSQTSEPEMSPADHCLACLEVSIGWYIQLESCFYYVVAEVAGKRKFNVMKKIVVVHLGNSDNNKMLSLVSRCSHLGCMSQRFDCILLVFIRRWGRLVTQNVINHFFPAHNQATQQQESCEKVDHWENNSPEQRGSKCTNHSCWKPTNHSRA